MKDGKPETVNATDHDHRSRQIIHHQASPSSDIKELFFFG
jgi:hypothetical protein